MFRSNNVVSVGKKCFGGKEMLFGSNTVFGLKNSVFRILVKENRGLR